MKSISVAVILFVCLTATAAFCVTEPPSGVIRVTKADPSSARKASIFVHEKHHAYKCETCHHTWDGGEIERCATCHPIFHHTNHEGMDCKECHKSWEMSRDVKECGDCHTDDERVEKSGTPNIIRVSHRALCKRCHRELEIAGKPTGPTSPCTSCHKAD